MENIFITEINIKKIRHLENIDIKLSDTHKKHLILTGKNGSGKTSVLDTIANYLDYAKPEEQSEKNFAAYEKRIFEYTKALDQAHTNASSDINLSFNTSWEQLKEEHLQGRLLLAYYKCDREFRADISGHVEKVFLDTAYTMSDAPKELFVKYLVDLKVTEALSKNNSNEAKANSISEWFVQFEKLLRIIFEDPTLELRFDEDRFSFFICQKGREPFDFNCMSSGFSAIMDIVLDIMMRMVKIKGRIFEFDLPGIVLIDEIETHLHLELQKKIMYILTKLFPNVQFIVSTHSPFILNSLDDVVIYDLENHILVENGLTDIPYDGIVKGYFQVDILSEKLKEKFDKYKSLVHKETLTDDDFEEIAELEMFLDEIPDYLALDITTEYQRLKEELEQREDI